MTDDHRDQLLIAMGDALSALLARQGMEVSPWARRLAEALDLARKAEADDPAG